MPRAVVDHAPRLSLESGPWIALVIALMGLPWRTGDVGRSSATRNIEDWGHMIQGHGGMLDRLDSVVFAAPIFFRITPLLVGALERSDPRAAPFLAHWSPSFHFRHSVRHLGVGLDGVRTLYRYGPRGPGRQPYFIMSSKRIEQIVLLSGSAASARPSSPLPAHAYPRPPSRWWTGRR
ncbi:phosphatidate cytidylyltransferase [Cupriavidus basilensis]